MKKPNKLVLKLNQTKNFDKLRLITDNIKDQVVIANPEKFIIYANSAATKNTGYSQEELLGKSLDDFHLWGGLMSQEFQQKLWQTIKRKKTLFSGEIINRNKSGAKYISELRAFPCLNKKKNIQSFIGIETNITKKRELNRVKTEFISLASHQLRTPLTNISLAIDLLLRKDDKELQEGLRASLKGIYKNVHQMAHLITTLLDVSKIQLGTFAVESQETDILELIDSSLKQVQTLLEKKHLHIEKHFNKIPRQLVTDRNIVQVVVQNLISNAVKYTPKGGHINFNILSQKDSLLISVKDSGLGIPMNQHAKIFTKFFRADNVKTKEAQGTGLGLYLSKVLLEAVGGKIWFESCENKGTTFYFSLPVGE
jgi:PAS domain S-box-containing protein